MRYGTQIIYPKMKQMDEANKGSSSEELTKKLYTILSRIVASGKSQEETAALMSACMGQYILILMQSPEYQESIRGRPDDEIAGAYATLMQGLMPSMPMEFQNLYTCIAMGRWHQYGQKIYEVSRGLTQRLANTRLTGVTTDVLKLPFPAIAIRVPTDMGMEFHEILVVETPEYEIGKNTKLLTEGPNGKEYTDVAQKIRDAGKCPRSWRISASRIEDAAGTEETLSVGTIRLWPGQDLGEALKDCLYAEWGDQTQQAMAFAINTVLYTSWPDTGEEFEERVSKDWLDAKQAVTRSNGYKKERAKAKLKGLWAEQRIYLGAKVPFMSAPEEEKNGAGHKIAVRTLVSGHWKMQPHGPRWTERKLIRVEPFWRGPMDGPVTNPIRRVS